MSRNQLYCSGVCICEPWNEDEDEEKERKFISTFISLAHASKRNTRMKFGFTCSSCTLLSSCRLFAFCYFLVKFTVRLSIPPTPIFPLHAFIALFCGIPIAEYCDLVSSTRRKRKMKVVDGEVYAIHEEVQGNMRRQK